MVISCAPGVENRVLEDRMRSYTLEELSNHYIATCSNVSRYVRLRDYLKLEREYNELRARLEQLEGIKDGESV